MATVQKSFVIVCSLLLSLFFTTGSMAGKVGFSKYLYNNTSYDIPFSGPFTEGNILDLSFKIHKYGYMSKGDYIDNPPYTFVKFTKGTGSEQDSQMQFLKIEKIRNHEDVATFLLSSFDGVNHGEIHLCILTKKDGTVHVNQVLIENHGVSIQGLAMKNGTVKAKMLYPGPSDPACCPTKKGSLTFKIIDDKIYGD